MTKAKNKEVLDHTVPYEILIRFDGSGKLAGAHKVSRRIVTIGEERVLDEVGLAEPIELAGLWGVLDKMLGAKP